MLTPDEGYYFGMGAFETIAVEDGKIIFLQINTHFFKHGKGEIR